MTSSRFRALVVDCETAPGMAYVFNAHKPFIQPEHIIKDTSVICFAAAWIDEPIVIFHADWIDGHKRMLEKAYLLIEEADAIIHYNGESFDMPHFQFEWAKLNIGPNAPKPQVDMLKTVNRKFRSLSHRLAFMGPELKVGEKIKHEGFQLWRDVVEGDKQAQKRMEKYCRGDVVLEKALYKKLLPWFGAQHPNTSLWSTECGDKPLCHACGSPRVMAHDYQRGTTYTYKRYRCRVCRAITKGRNSIKSEPKPLTIGV